MAGARPNFVKAAPLLKAFRDHNLRAASCDTISEVRLLHTGQHYDEAMSDVFFRELGIRPPDINLRVGSGSHACQTATVMTSIEPELEREKPDWAVVVGDVNSTMACTLVCAKMGIRVAHLEAGLRSYDRTMPEEINRVVTDSLADLLLTPSADANDNLSREGIQKSRIHQVGNIMIDSLVQNLEAARHSKILQTLALRQRQFVYVTLHRPSNVDHRENLAAIYEELCRLSDTLDVVFPVHPRTCKMLMEFGVMNHNPARLRMVTPVGYHDSLCLTQNARLVITDSGGLQEESTFFRTPCLTLRKNTERPITVTLGSNRLTELPNLAKDICNALSGAARIGRIPPLWDGKTAERVVQIILQEKLNDGMDANEDLR